MPFTRLRTQNIHRLKLLEATPVVFPGFATLHVVFVGAQPARPIKKSWNELTIRLPRPKPQKWRGYRISSHSKPARKLCVPFVQESWSEYWIWFEGANAGCRPPPIAKAPAKVMTGGCV